MAGVPANIFVPGRAYVFLAPTGTTAPTDPAGTYNAALVDVGLFENDSLKFSTDPNFNEIESHQMDDPARIVLEKVTTSMQVNLQEWKGSNFQAIYGGGTLVQSSAAVAGPPARPAIYKFTPPALGARTELMCVIKVVDGTRNAALVIPRCMQIEGADHDLKKGAGSTLPLRLRILGTDGVDPFYWLSDSPTFAPS